MAEFEPCCAACVFWSPEYEPTDYAVEQAPDLPIFNTGARGWCTHGMNKKGENVNRKEICGTYWESKRSGLITAHETCCPEWKLRT